jgi:hypothetical protein
MRQQWNEACAQYIAHRYLQVANTNKKSKKEDGQWSLIGAGIKTGAREMTTRTYIWKTYKREYKRRPPKGKMQAITATQALRRELK